MQKKIGRLFITEYENAREWTDGKRTILSKVQQDDFYIIFKTGKNKELSSVLKDLIQDMGNKKELVDATNLNDDDYKSLIIKKIKENSTENTDVYFLFMDPIYHELKDKIQGVSSIQSRRNYKVGRNLSKNTMMKNPAGLSKVAEQNSDIFSSMTDVLSDNKVHSDIEKNENENVSEENTEKKATFVPLWDRDKTPKNPQKNVSSKQPDHSNKNKKRNIKKEESTVNAYDSLTINDIEKIIFEKRVAQSELKIKYTELDDAKAKLVGLLFDRLVESIKRLIPKIESHGFDDKEFVKFVTTIIKSDEYEDFKEGLSIVVPGIDLDIRPQTYIYLKDEAKYYAKVCKMLYEEDEWA